MDDAQQLLDTATGTDVLAALTALRELRDRLDAYEPELIAAARAAGVSWADLAPALGVASRQAAERRYLRLRPGNRRLTGDERVLAERDRRAGDRAVTAWARANGADLRQLAGQISALSDLGPDAQPTLDRLHTALGDADATALPDLLARTEEHLPAALADRVRAVGEQIDAVRSNTQSARTHHRRPAEFADGSSPNRRV